MQKYILIIYDISAIGLRGLFSSRAPTVRAPHFGDHYERGPVDQLHRDSLDPSQQQYQ
jgi:hypothetical protein